MEMDYHATGSFEVSIKPQIEPDTVEGIALGRLSLDKLFHGDLEAAGKGEMLTAMTGVEGSAGYVAVERVTGTLHSRRGSFVFQHSGIMNRGEQQLSITVVPDSGTGQLSGIAGLFSIKFVDNKHTYTFDYSLPE